MSISKEQVEQALAEVVDPNTAKNLIASKSVKNLRVDGSDVSLDVELGYPANSQFAPLREAVVARLKILGAEKIYANVYSRIVTHSGA